MDNSIKQKTISDFGEQWNKYTRNDGYYGSADFLKDFLEPLVKIDDIRGKNIADVGSGTGRIVNMLLEAGASHVTAIEPSDCFEVLKSNTGKAADRISYINDSGENIPEDGNFDYVISFGVIHHIPEPEQTISAIYKSLKPGGKVVIWLYGREGNELYLALVKPLRVITTVIPNFVLSLLSWILAFLLVIYERICRIVWLPMRTYMNNVIRHMSLRQKKLIIFDQLNPAWAKYYRKDEALKLFSNNWKNIEIYHRHNYSWTVVAEK